MSGSQWWSPVEAWGLGVEVRWGGHWSCVPGKQPAGLVWKAAGPPCYSPSPETHGLSFTHLFTLPVFSENLLFTHAT